MIGRGGVHWFETGIKVPGYLKDSRLGKSTRERAFAALVRCTLHHPRCAPCLTLIVQEACEHVNLEMGETHETCPVVASAALRQAVGGWALGTNAITRRGSEAGKAWSAASPRTPRDGFEHMKGLTYSLSYRKRTWLWKGWQHRPRASLTSHGDRRRRCFKRRTRPMLMRVWQPSWRRGVFCRLLQQGMRTSHLRLVGMHAYPNLRAYRTRRGNHAHRLSIAHAAASPRSAKQVSGRACCACCETHNTRAHYTRTTGLSLSTLPPAYSFRNPTKPCPC